MNVISRSSASSEDARIDLTPMLDVVFIMLIFFIVTASFVKELGLRLDTPPPNAPSGSDDNPNVVVSLKSDNQIFIDGRSVDHRALRAYFERHKAEHPKAALVIRANHLARTYTVARISNAAREANIYQIILQSIE